MASPGYEPQAAAPNHEPSVQKVQQHHDLDLEELVQLPSLLFSEEEDFREVAVLVQLDGPSLQQVQEESMQLPVLRFPEEVPQEMAVAAELVVSAVLCYVSQAAAA